MHRFLLSLLLVAVVVQARKFCPKEKNGDKCKAKENEYKCGVFFRDLTPKVDFAWLGALPEAITRAQNDGATKKDIEDILGADVNVAGYKGDVCGDTLANSRCYAQMQKASTEPLDSCGKSLIRTKWSEQATETGGDYLCGQVHRWLKRNSDYKANGKDNIDIAFMYSQCGGEWTDIQSEGVNLASKEPLCCTNQGKFRRCDGSDFNKTCN